MTYTLFFLLNFSEAVAPNPPNTIHWTDSNIFLSTDKSKYRLLINPIAIKTKENNVISRLLDILPSDVRHSLSQFTTYFSF